MQQEWNYHLDSRVDGLLFGQEIEVTLVSSEDKILYWDNPAVRDLVMSKLNEKGIKVLTNGRVKEVRADGVQLEDGRFLDCNVPIWATGAAP